jgi:hypothetical protein
MQGSDNIHVVYVTLYGRAIAPRKRFAMMNALENYFYRFGKIRDLGRLKAKYSRLGDFFIEFEHAEDTWACVSALRLRENYLISATSLKLPIFRMEVC